MTDVNERTFDWRPPTDERRAGNIPFAMGARATTIQTGKPLRSHSWKRHLWLDQGQEGSCTGFGAAHTLGEGQYWRQLDNTAARSFYKGAQRHDEWPGENYEGSSVLGVMEYLHHETDYLREYWWATNLDELSHALAYYGPVEFGTNWYLGMMQPDSHGYIHPTGTWEGGHAYCAGQIYLPQHRARIDQSWGEDWGWGGCAWIDLDDLAGLLADGGECALPRKTKAA